MGQYSRIQRFAQRQFRGRSPVLAALLCGLSPIVPLLTAPVSASTPAPPVQSASSPIESAKELYRAGRYAEAEVLWQQAADRHAAQGDRLNQAMALSNLSLTAQQLGKWDAAKAAIAQSLALLNAQSPTPNRQRILAATLDIQGQLQQAVGQPNDALKTWKTSAQLHRNSGNANGAIASQINQAQALQDLGLYPQACQTVLDALSIAHKGCELSTAALQTPNASSLPAPLQILGLRSLGNILRVVGQPEQSQVALKKGWQLAQPLGDAPTLAALSLSSGNTARALANRALATQASPTLKLPKDFASPPPEACLAEATGGAAGFYRQAIACYRSAEAAPTVGVQSQLNLLNLSIEMRQWAIVPDLLSRLQSRLAQLPPSPAAVSAQLKLAQNLMCLQAGVNPSSAKLASPILQPCLFANAAPTSAAPTSAADTPLQAAQIPSWSDIQTLATTAYRQAQILGDRAAAANALGYVAAVSQQTGTLATSQQLTEQAVQQLSAFNNPELIYLWQWQLGRLYHRQGKQKEAIAAYTLAYETLQSLRRDLVATDPDIQFTFRDRVEPVYRELVELLLQPETSGQAQLKLARDVIESLQLAELNNFFREACIEARAQPIDRLDPKAAVVYGIVLPERLAVILSLPGKPLRYYATALKSDPQGYGEVDRTVDDLYATLNPFIFNPNPLQPKQKLYDWLLRPAAAELKNSGIETLVFVLDGALRSIPVAALHDGKQYLAETYNLALTPGLQLLSSRPRSTEKTKTLVGGLAESRQGFSPLPGVEQEVKEISGTVPSQVLLNGQFTRDRLRTTIEATPFSGIHLATHAQFSSRAENTFLLTWDERVNVKNLDQLLRDGDRSRTNPIELLILSACQTAAGDKRATLGLAGVAVRSGARSTLATLWSVQDQSTADLMTNFYKALQPGVSKAQALRQAQLSLLKSPRYQHPYYWAPFVLVGNWL
ncbi:CHAT domain-containing protein [Altericista sp. CCNU0014]|uniref:CHAT domain-containing protein n=1 Tax=Altericista sp. CCNU0014 TaxID=3082949 RepID=UPI00384DFFE3